MPQDPAIKCPKCGEPIHLDETIAGPIISQIRSEANEAIRKAEAEADARVSKAAGLEADLAEKERTLSERESSIQTQVNQAIAVERQKIAVEERENIRKEIAPEMDAERAKTNILQEKLNESQRAELTLRQERDAVDQRAKELELEVARKIDEQRTAIQEQASRDAGESFRLQIAEKDKAIAEASANIQKAQADAAEKSSRLSTLEDSLAERSKDLSQREATVQLQVNQAIAAERQKIAIEERESLRKELEPELEAERAKATILQDKLKETQKAELQLRQEKDAIDQRANELDLEVARKVDEQRKAIQEQAGKDADESARLKIAEKDKTISDMQLKLEEAQRKAVQGSQQLQGEVLELDFETTLRQMFPQDTIEPVKTGARGGDILQRVLGEMGRSVGTMFWETKRAQTWGGDWTTKAKQDAADAKAEVATIVSAVLPKGIHDFGLQDGVWCVKPTHAVMLGLAIRQGIIATADARLGAQGRETKVERLYAYMIGPEFRTTLEGIAHPFRELHDELIAEKRATYSRWKRQEKRIERVLSSVASLQGDLQGIAGGEMLKLPTFELESGDEDNE
jgi:hypothetical protein